LLNFSARRKAAPGFESRSAPVPLKAAEAVFASSLLHNPVLKISPFFTGISPDMY
jgi:hypothetical protein